MTMSIEIVRECPIQSYVGMKVDDLLCLLNPRIDLNDLFESTDIQSTDSQIGSHPNIMLIARITASMSTREVYAELREASLRPVPYLGLIVFAVQYPLLAEEMMPVAMGGKSFPGQWGVEITPPNQENQWRREIEWRNCRSFFAFEPCSIDRSAMAFNLAPETDRWHEGTNLLVAPRSK